MFRRNYSKLHVLAALTAVLISSAGESRAANKADLIIKNATVYTGLEGGADWKSAIAIRRGKIEKVGSDSEVMALAQASTRIIDADSKLILPGFHDTHVHLAEGGAELLQCRLNSAKTQADVIALLQNWAVKNPVKGKDNWILAAGLPLPAVAAAPLNCQLLDQVANNRPILVYAEDGHSAWLNTLALKAAGITATTQTTCGGIIELDKNGQPTGCLREGALALAQKVLPVLSLTERSKALAEAIKLANSFGITSAQDAHANEEVLTAYYDLARRKKLNLKIVAALHTGTMTDLAYVRLMEQAKKYSRYPGLSAHSAKIFADGVIESHTAALLEAYADQPQNKGELIYSPEQLQTMVKKLSDRGFQIHVHAIGDRAVRAALDAFSQCPDKKDLRHQIAHVQLVNPQDYSRFGSLNVTANCQAAWAYEDAYIKDLTAPLIGARMARVYPFKSLKRAGARLAAGSDWTVSTLNPLEAIQTAVTRQAPQSPSLNSAIKPPLNIEEALSVNEIVQAYTTGGAYANHSENTTGTLEAGKAADLIMLDKNIFTADKSEIASAKVLLTLLDGKIVFQKGF